MKKNKLFLGLLALAFSLILLGCTTIDTVGKENYGTFQNITVPAKDFQSLGLVFSETFFDTDAKGSRGDVFTYNALLKEAQKLGADTIVNVVIDVKKEGANEWFKLFGIKKDRGVVQGKETWYGSATAIKYDAAIKNVDTTVVTDNAVTTTSERSIMNSSGTVGSASGAAPGQKTAFKWYNPFTWFKK
jgi:hypothetical protein